MYLSQEGLDQAIASMTDGAYRHLGMADYVHADRTRSARKRWKHLTAPEASGWALALHYRPAAQESSRGCCGGTEPSILMEEVHQNWLDEMVLTPVKWFSLTDPLTLGLKREFTVNYFGAQGDPDVVQAVLRFPHVDVEHTGYVSPLGGEIDLSLTDNGSMYVWHLTPVSDEEGEMWVDAYNSAEAASELMPSLTYNFCCSEDPVSELVSPDLYAEWLDDYGSPAVCSETPTDDTFLIGGDRSMPICSCCSYWELRSWLHEKMFPSMDEYLGLVRDSIGPSFYDSRWNDAQAWFKTGLDVAHDMAHLIANEGADEWASWWESRFLPEPCFGGANALPLAQQRFESLASSA